MSAGEAVAIALAGLAAGTINAVVGSGTLVTFPVLLACGYAPVTANVSNTVGLVLGNVSGAVGYRRELAGQRGRALRLGALSLAGGATGAVLLLLLPSSAFTAIVPAFIAVALVLIVAQPRLADWLAARRLRRERARHAIADARDGGVVTVLAVYVAGVYGGYFGAAQGILLLGILGVTVAQSLQRTNALKNVLVGLVNGVAAVYFIAVAHVAWGPAAVIAASSILGAQLGARWGRRLPPAALRAVIVCVGVFAIVRLMVG